MTLHYAKRVLALLTLTILVGVSVVAAATKLRGGNLLSVQSQSMVPALNKGDLVSVQSVTADQLKVGDVITFISPLNAKETITHRIVELPSWNNGMRYTTKGDANVAADPPLASKDIVGRVTHSVPYAGYGADFIRKPFGLILVIYIPALFIMGSEMRRLAEHYRRQAKYVLAGHESKLMHTMRPNRAIMMSRLAPLILLVPLGFSIKTYAALNSTAVLTGNTISTGPLVPEEPEEPEQPPTNGGTTVTCTSNTNVNVSSTTNQNASSGDVNNSGNTTSGNTSSGNASNTNTNNTTVNVTGCTPQ